MTRTTRAWWIAAFFVAIGMFVYPGFAFSSNGDRKPAVAAAPEDTTTTVPVTTTSTTATTTTVPQTTTTTVAVEPAPPADPCAAEIAPEATVKVDKGCTVSGDVRVSRDQARASTKGAIAYFDGEGTKSVTFMSEDGWIYAHWGASVSNKSVDELCGGDNCLRNTWPELPDYPDPEVGGASQAARAAAQAEAAARPVHTQPASPARAPTASPPPATEPPAEPGFIDVCWDSIGKIPAGSTRNVPAGCNVRGDVYIDGIKFHDSQGHTCQITVMNRGGSVYAPKEYNSGADVSSRTPESLAAEGGNCEIKNWSEDVGKFENEGSSTDVCWDSIGKIPAGSTRNVPAGCNVRGDVYIDGIKFHDSDSATCQITVMNRGGSVNVPSEYTGSSADVTSRDPNDLAAEGCGSGVRVLIKEYPAHINTFG